MGRSNSATAGRPRRPSSSAAGNPCATVVAGRKRLAIDLVPSSGLELIEEALELLHDDLGRSGGIVSKVLQQVHDRHALRQLRGGGMHGIIERTIE